MKKLLSMGLVFGLSTAALSAGKKNTTTFDYRAQLNYNDLGLLKSDTNKDPGSVNYLDGAMFLGFDGAVGGVDYQVYLNLLASKAESITEVAVARKSCLNGLLTLEVGRNYTLVGGFDNANAGYKSHALSFMTENGSFPGSVPQARTTVDLKAAGQFVLALTNDLQTHFSTKQELTWMFQWSSAFGPATPMFQLATYDGGHSKIMGLGVALSMAGIEAALDYVTDSRAAKSGTKTVTTEASSLVVDVAYNLGMVTPFFKFMKYDVKQPDTDAKMNSALGKIDDNDTRILVGANYNKLDAAMTPFFAALITQGDYPKTTDGKAETKTTIAIKLGVYGSI